MRKQITSTQYYIRMEEKRQYELYDVLNEVFEDQVREALQDEVLTLPRKVLETLYPASWLNS